MNFFQRLFGNAINDNNILTLSNFKTKHSTHYNNSSAALAEIDRAAAKKQELYFGLALRTPGLSRGQRGKRTQLTVITCFWLDVDYGSTGHASENLPPTLDDALDLIAQNGPPPTLLVNSGHGLHAYWVFSAPADVSTLQLATAYEDALLEWQTPYMEAAAARGWHMDRLFSADRVLRVPGTYNYKDPSNPKPVTLLTELDVTYPFKHPPSLPVSPPSDGKSSPPPSGCSPDLATDSSASEKLTNSEGGVPYSENAAPFSPNQVLEKLSKCHDPLVITALSGSAFAVPGERDIKINQLCAKITWASDGAPPGLLLAIIRPALASLEGTDAIDRYENALGKLERHGDEYHAERAATAAQDEGIRSALRRAAIRNAEDREKAIIQHESAYYIRLEDGNYSAPVTDRSLRTHLKHLAPDMDLFIHNRDTGKSRAARTSELLDKYATAVHNVIADLTIQISRYDTENKTFYEAVCRRPDILPTYDPSIAKWLELLCSDATTHAQLLDYLATVTDLSRQTCALYLSGKSGAGKSMLAFGIARLFAARNPTSLKNALGNFNGEIAQCPLIFADEKIPEGKSADLRELIGSDSRSLNRKFLPSTPLNGAVRLIIAGNNEHLLVSDEQLTADDLDAIGKRYLHIDAPVAAVEYLKALGGRAATEHWVNGNAIAAHCLWLRDNHKVIVGNRFLVEGRQTSLHKRLPTMGNFPGMLCDWLIKFLNTTDTIRQKMEQEGTILVGNGEFLVNAAAVVQNWETLVTSDKHPNITHVGRTLTTFSTGIRKIGKSNRFRIINLDTLFAWSDDNLTGDKERMESLINRELTEEQLAPAKRGAGPFLGVVIGGKTDEKKGFRK